MPPSENCKCSYDLRLMYFYRPSWRATRQASHFSGKDRIMTPRSRTWPFRAPVSNTGPVPDRNSIGTRCGVFNEKLRYVRLPQTERGEPGKGESHRVEVDGGKRRRSPGSLVRRPVS